MTIIGIDFGTELNKIGCYNPYGLKIIANNYKNPSTPSVAYMLHKDKWVFGERAAKLSTSHPKQFIYETKLMLGRKFNDPFIQKRRKIWQFATKSENGYIKIVIEVDGEILEFFPYEIEGLILKNLVEIANSSLNLPAKTSNVIISVPASFNDEQKKDLMKAAKYANLLVLRIVTDPISAFHCYINKSKISHAFKKNFLLYDIGYSTLSASIIKIIDGNYDIITVNDNDINGMQFRESFCNKIQEKFEKSYPEKLDFLKNPKTKSKLLTACDEAKMILSEAYETDIYIEEDDDDDSLTITLSEKEFNKMNDEFFEKAMIPVKNLMKKAKIDKNSISNLFLIGGLTYMKKIRENLKEVTGQDPCPSADPREVVALGASIIGSKLTVDDTLLSGQAKWGQMIGENIFQKEEKMFFYDLEIFGKFNNTIGILFESKEEIIVSEGSQIPCVVDQVYQIEGKCKIISFYEKDKSNILFDYRLPKPISNSVRLIIEMTFDTESQKTRFKGMIESNEFQFESSKPVITHIYKDFVSFKESKVQGRSPIKPNNKVIFNDSNKSPSKLNDKIIVKDTSKGISPTNDKAIINDKNKSPRYINDNEIEKQHRSKSPARSNVKSICTEQNKTSNQLNDKLINNDKTKIPIKSNDNEIKKRHRSKSPTRSNDKIIGTKQNKTSNQLNDKLINNDKTKSLIKSNDNEIEKRHRSKSPTRSNDKIIGTEQNKTSIQSNDKLISKDKTKSSIKSNDNEIEKQHRSKSPTRSNDNNNYIKQNKTSSQPNDKLISNDKTNSTIKSNGNVIEKQRSKSPKKVNDNIKSSNKIVYQSKPSPQVNVKAINENKTKSKTVRQSSVENKDKISNENKSNIKSKTVSYSKNNIKEDDKDKTSIKSKNKSKNKANIINRRNKSNKDDDDTNIIIEKSKVQNKSVDYVASIDDIAENQEVESDGFIKSFYNKCILKYKQNEANIKAILCFLLIIGILFLVLLTLMVTF